MSNVEWEKVCAKFNDSDTYRLRVPGGWLYRVCTSSRMQVCFVPEASAMTTKRQRCEASLCKEHIGALEETAGDAVVELEAIKEELAHWKEAHKQLSVELRSRGALLVSAEKERDEARAELATGGVVPRSKEQIFALAAKEERGRAREVRLVYPIVATRSNDGREWVRVVTKEGGDE